MGFKTTNYRVEGYNTTLETAYGYLAKMDADKNGNVKAHFGVYQTRDDATGGVVAPYETKEVNFKADKKLPLWEQAYTAGRGVFSGWIDDIDGQELAPMSDWMMPEGYNGI